MTYDERIWIRPNYPETRILVLGESWYGDFAGDLATDAGYIAAYLENKQTDRMYTKMANASGLGKQAFWKAIAFTNFVQRVGPTRDCRPTPLDYKAARERLERVLSELSPKGVWILGIEQSAYLANLVASAGITYAISHHPTSVGLTNAALGAGWTSLTERLTLQHGKTDA